MAGKGKKGFALATSSQHLGRDVAIWMDARGKTRVDPLGPNLLSSDMQYARRSRWPAQYKFRTTREGLYLVEQTRTHVWHESGLELAGLMMLDFYLEIANITAQPCLIQWADGSKHYPDFLITLKDNTQLLFDVHAQRFMDDKIQATFDKTFAACNRIGWDYKVFTGIDPIVLANLRFIAGYRHLHNAPPTELAELLTSNPEASLKDIRSLTPQLPDLLAYANIYHLIWTKKLDFDVTRPLTVSTLLRSAA